MPTIVFKVNLTPSSIGGNDGTGGYAPLSDTNLPNTFSTFIPDNLIDNHVWKTGTTLTYTGMEAMYFLNNYTTGVNPPLTVVSNTPTS